jgi:TonB family protein
MIRCFTLSIGVHLGFVLALLVLSTIHPPIEKIEPVRVSLLQPVPETPTPDPQPTPRETPVATPRPTPRPTPVPTPPPTPEEVIVVEDEPEELEPLTSEDPKQRLSEAEVVEVTPTPTPTPAPRVTPAPTPQPTPRATPEPDPTPAPTPPPVDEDLLEPEEEEEPPRVETDYIAVEGDAVRDLSQTYFRVALLRVQENFEPPIRPPDVFCRVRFRILRDGEIRQPRIVRSTGSNSLDQWAIRALQRTEQLPPLYESFEENYLDVTFTFRYERTEGE